MQIALFQPDIPQNTGTILRLCACLDVAAHIIEPAGFPVSDRHFRRAGMDYLDQVTITRHDSWSKFEQWRHEKAYRLVLFTTKAAGSYLDYRYDPADILLFGRESAGVPDEVAGGGRCPAGDPDQAGFALAQCGDGRGHGIGRGVAANQCRNPGDDAVSYAVKEIFLTLQGEGAHAGRAAVFCRFSGCNLWSGREQDRADATCRFCDTDFVGTDGTLGGRYASAAELADTIAAQWTGANANRYVVLTGGEPLLQVDTALVDALHAHGFSRRRRDQRHDRPARRHGLDLRQPQSRRGTCDTAAAMNSSWSTRRRTPRRSALLIWPSSASRCSRWTGLT